MPEPTTTTATLDVTDAQRREITAMLDAARDVNAAVAGSLDYVKAILDKVLVLATPLATLYRNVNKGRTEDLKAGGFHSKVVERVAMIAGDDKAVVWPLSADQTWAAKGYSHNAKAWNSYRARIARDGNEASWMDYVTHVEHYKAGRRNNAGEDTDAMQQWRDDNADKRYRDETRKDFFDDVDWSPMMPDDASDQDWLAFWRKLRYEANRQLLRKERALRRTNAGKKVIAAAKSEFNAAVKS